MSCITCTSGFRNRSFSAQAGKERQRVHDRRHEDQKLREKLPDLRDVAEADEERREDQAGPKDEDEELDEQRNDQEPVESTVTRALRRRKPRRRSG